MQEVETPNLIRGGRGETVRFRRFDLTNTRAPFTRRHPQAFTLPQPIHAFVVNLPPTSTQFLVRQPVAPPFAALGERVQLLHQLRFIGSLAA